MASDSVKIVGIIVILIVVLSVVGVGVYWVLTYNKLVNENEQIDSQWAQVTNVYQLKFDKIPQLLNLTQSTLNWEYSTYAAIAELRDQFNESMAAGDVQGAANASDSLDAYMAPIIITVEAYPDLDGVALVDNLLYEISGMKNRIATERMYYNDYVRTYNSHIKRWPASWVANSGDFEERPYYESPLAPAQP